MKTKTAKIILAFIVGQVVQLVLALFAQVAFINRPILFSLSAGFLILVAIAAGTWIAAADDSKDAKHARPLSYQDYADGIMEDADE